MENKWDSQANQRCIASEKLTTMARIMWKNLKIGQKISNGILIQKSQNIITIQWKNKKESFTFGEFFARFCSVKKGVIPK